MEHILYKTNLKLSTAAFILLIGCSSFSKVALHLELHVAPNINHHLKLQHIVLFDTKLHEIVWTEN